MIRFLPIAIALAVFAPAHSAEPSAPDRQALLKLAERMDQAWTAADADANAQLFAPDATARFAEDPLRQGRAEIRAQFETFFKDRPPNLRHVTKIERMEQLNATLVLWDAEVTVERRRTTGGWEALTRIRNVTLAVRQPDGWRVQAVRAFPLR